MGYLYEQLNDETFQRLCQALLTREHRFVQCFPVGQPDGGRDAIILEEKVSRRSFVVYQVKFSRDPRGIDDVYRWLTDVIAGELPKIQRLVARGASGYFLMTNVSASGHLDSGTMDKVDNLLQKTIRNVFGISAQCLWRDDLDARLSNAWDLQWAYPQILSGADVLATVFRQGIAGDQERRQDVIRAYLQDQYDRDRQVRFTQVDLESDLLSLFVDVPITNDPPHKGRYSKLLRDIVHGENERATSEEEPGDAPEVKIGAVRFLLDPRVQRDIPQLVIQGAPGQGKSTIAQYLCQIYRLHILKDQESAAKLPTEHLPRGHRLPFRVDLRDLASWLVGSEVWATGHASSHLGRRSLETFLAALVQHYSGGLDFTVNDLSAVVKVSAVLLVLDGLDEVPDLAVRTQLVQEVAVGIARLRVSAASLQVIITSRPAAFQNVPGFPEEKFPHFVLENLTEDQINEYAERWISVRRLPTHVADTVRNVLAQKLQLPHLRELSKNAMQLAILLNLVHTRGSALPDQRTAIYDSYVERFFDRESEKDQTVTKYRVLLMDIHRYLGWLLHSEAEMGKHNGVITKQRLRELLKAYLEAEGQSVGLVDLLMHKAIERLVFLVSRVEGMFEFEVQPLREYFAARHLYETIPYAPAGTPCKGTLLDRFDALIRNFYWTNVARFFAGCLDKGELPAIVLGLRSLSTDTGYRDISHPRGLAVMFLSDHVFEEAPKLRKQVVHFLLEGLKVRSPMPNRRALILPSGDGHEELIQACLEMLDEDDAPSDYRVELLGLLARNIDDAELHGVITQKLNEASGEGKCRWLELANYPGVVREIEADDVRAILTGNETNPQIISGIIDAEHARVLEDYPEAAKLALDLILDNWAPYSSSSDSILSTLSSALNPFAIVRALEDGNVLHIASTSRWDHLKTDRTCIPTVLLSCVEALSEIRSYYDQPKTLWTSSAAPWDAVIETISSTFGRRWICRTLAVLAAMVIDEQGVKDRHIGQETLCDIALSARQNAGNTAWWNCHLASGRHTDAEDTLLVLLAVALAHPSTLVSVLGRIEAFVNELPQREWECLCRSAQILYSVWMRLPNRAEYQDLQRSQIPDDLGPRSLCLLDNRFGWLEHGELLREDLMTPSGTDRAVLSFYLRWAVHALTTGSNKWDKLLPLAAFSYKHGLPGLTSAPRTGKKLPDGAAREILDEPHLYPRRLVYLAEEVTTERIGKNATAVAVVAETDMWFDGSDY